MRLDKFLSESSIERRKAIRILIKEGHVKVNGQTETIPASEINEHRDVIEYLNEAIPYKENVYYMFHKPSGCVTARSDKKDITVFDYLQNIDYKGLFPVGRLDKDTEGLLLITNDGMFNHQLMYPDKHVEKTYFFWAFGTLNSAQIHTLETGILIQPEAPITRPAKIRISKEGFFSEFKQEIDSFIDEKSKRNNSFQSVLAGFITISEGRKHQVKRMLKACGCHIFYLKRISIGGVALDETLQPGKYRELTKAELESLSSN